MSFGVLLPGAGALLGNTRADLQHTGREIDAIPTQRAQLPAPRSSHHGKPDEHAPVRVFPGLDDDASRLMFGRRLRIRLRDCGLRGWIASSPRASPHRIVMLCGLSADLASHGTSPEGLVKRTCRPGPPVTRVRPGHRMGRSLVDPVLALCALQLRDPQVRTAVSAAKRHCGYGGNPRC
jgi:hypothetical protein